MANIVFESRCECWCSDCGSKGNINCSCEPCELCCTYSEELIHNEKEDVYICESCLEELNNERRGRK